MDIAQIRRENLRKYKSRHNLTGKAFAERLGKSPAQINAIIGKNPRRAIGSALARDIEASLGKPKGWLDTLHVTDADEAGDGYTTIKALDEVGGKKTDHPSTALDPIRSVVASLGWVQHFLGTDPDTLQVLSHYGPAMETTINHGDTMLVDTSVREYTRDGIYLVSLQDEDTVMVRRMSRTHDGIIMTADNRAVIPHPLAAEEWGAKIHGQVIGVLKLVRV